MERRMDPLNVKTDNDSITIEQDYGNGEASTIYVGIDQIPTLIKWLQEAVSEITSNSEGKERI